jgi:serine O-acetyltransferase
MEDALPSVGAERSDVDTAIEPAPADELWPALRQEAKALLDKEPGLFELFRRRVLDHDSLDAALAGHLSGRLSSPELTAHRLDEIFREAFAGDRSLGAAAQADLFAVKSRDPACKGYMAALLNSSGFWALQAHRVAHWLWTQERCYAALHLQGRLIETFGIDIHPAARIGAGILIDHGTALVIGETAIVEDGVSMLHEVTLGGTGKARGDRHPKVRRGVSIGAGAKILGNIEIGAHSRIGAGSVVLSPVAPFTTVVGVPARVVARPIDGVAAAARLDDGDRELALRPPAATARRA